MSGLAQILCGCHWSARRELIFVNCFVDEIEKNWLPGHEVEEAAPEADKLGSRGVPGIGAKKVEEPDRSAMNRRAISRRAMELLVGARKFQIGGLSWSSLDAGCFLQVLLASCVSAAVPWNSLRSEPRAFAPLLLLLRTFLSSPLANLVTCSVASEAGFGFASTVIIDKLHPLDVFWKALESARQMELFVLVTFCCCSRRGRWQ